MAAGIAQIPVIDGGNTSRNVQVWSSIAGNLTGNLSFMQTIVGGDQVNPVTTANPLPVSVASGNITLLAGAAAIGNITAITSALPAGTNSIGNIASITNTVAVGGVAANGVSVSGNPVLTAGRAQSSEATPVGNGQVATMAMDLAGKMINMPYANKENMVRGNVTVGNTTPATIIASQGAGNKTYVTSIQIGNTGNTTVMVQLNDSAASNFIAPAGGGSNVQFPVPLVTAVNTALQATLSGNTTSVYINAQGFSGS